MSNARNLAIAGSSAVGGMAPTGVVLPFAGSAAPTGWLLCFGQTISRTTYSFLFTAIGTSYGAGDGSTTFALPDLRGRLAGGKDDMGGTAASRLNVTLTGTKASTINGNITGLSSTAGLSVGMKAFGTGIGTNAVITAITSSTAVTLSVNSTSTGSTSIRFAVVDGATLGAVGGDHVHKLTTAQLAAHSHTLTAINTAGGGSSTSGVGESNFGNVTATDAAGSDQAHPNVQPTIILNYIIKT